MTKIQAQCHCGAALITRSPKLWLYWLDNHNCPGAQEEAPEPAESESASRDIHYGDSHVERSYQWNGQYDGERIIPEVQARRPIGFQVE